MPSLPSPYDKCIVQCCKFCPNHFYDTHYFHCLLIRLVMKPKSDVKNTIQNVSSVFNMDSEGGGGERKKIGSFHYALHACWMSVVKIISDCLWQADRNTKDEQPELHATEKRPLWRDCFPNSCLPCHNTKTGGFMRHTLSQQKFIDITAISCKYCTNVKNLYGLLVNWTFLNWGMYCSDSPVLSL